MTHKPLYRLKQLCKETTNNSCRFLNDNDDDGADADAVGDEK